MDENVKETLRSMVDAFKEMEQAKRDCKVVVDAAFDLYLNNDGLFDKKYLAKIAKAIANQKLDVIEDDVKNSGEILQMITELKD